MVFPVFVSRFPVGSSPMRIFGLLMRARAMATRCFCPPESSSTRESILSCSPTSSSSLIASFLVALLFESK